MSNGGLGELNLGLDFSSEINSGGMAPNFFDNPRDLIKFAAICNMIASLPLPFLFALD